MARHRRAHTAIAITRPGLEQVCAGEVRGLGLHVGAVHAGAVSFAASTRALYQAVRWLRTATRVLVVAASFRATAFSTLVGHLENVDWTPFVGTDPVAVRVRSEQSRLYHTDAIAERVTGVLEAATGAWTAEPAERHRAIRLDIRVLRDTVTVRVDATGESMDRRGWRLATAKAPLPPTVAAAALRAIGWDGQQPLLDPLCGAGTIPIEAARLAGGRQPATDRNYALQRWPSFAPGTWGSAAAPPAGLTIAHRPPRGAVVAASDRDAGAVQATRDNAERADVEERLRVAQRALTASRDLVEGAPAGWILTNPPWGDRVVGDGDLRDLHASLGALLRRLPGWRLGIVTADPRLAQATGVELTRGWRTRVSGRNVILLVQSAAQQ